ncbi:MAG: YceI family protein [Candidatus Omnitrophota bacterium]
MNSRIRKFLILSTIFVSFAQNAWAKTQNYYFTQEHSFLKGEIKYSLIGTYQAAFNDFEGVLILDEQNIENSSVDMKIKTSSIRSKYPALDRIVRSRRLLDAEKYPYMTFKSKSIKRLKSGYFVEGTVNLHDITKDLSFIFYLDGPTVEDKEKLLKARGRWTINRKDFDIIWNRWLDHGGIIVGDNIDVAWEIKAYH